MFFIVPVFNACTGNYDAIAIPSSTFQFRSPYLYAVSGDGNLRIYDMSNPGTPVLKSTTSMSNNGTRWPRLVYPLMYVPVDDAGVGTNPGLQVWDVEDPLAPTMLGFAAMPDTVQGVRSCCISGDLAICATGVGSSADRQVGYFDVSDPSNPSFDSFWSMDGSFQGACVWTEAYGSYWFAQTWNSPSSNYFYSSLPGAATGSAFLNISVSSSGGSGLFTLNPDGQTAYSMQGNDNRFRVIDISNPLSMSVTGTVAPFSSASAACSVVYRPSTQKAYVGKFNGSQLGVYAIDVSNPASPTLLGTVASDNEGVQQVAVSDDECLTLIFSTWTNPKFFFQNDPEF